MSCDSRRSSVHISSAGGLDVAFTVDEAIVIIWDYLPAHCIEGKGLWGVIVKPGICLLRGHLTSVCTKWGETSSQKVDKQRPWKWTCH